MLHENPEDMLAYQGNGLADGQDQAMGEY